MREEASSPSSMALGRTTSNYRELGDKLSWTTSFWVEPLFATSGMTLQLREQLLEQLLGQLFSRVFALFANLQMTRESGHHIFSSSGMTSNVVPSEFPSFGTTWGVVRIALSTPCRTFLAGGCRLMGAVTFRASKAVPALWRLMYVRFCTVPTLTMTSNTSGAGLVRHEARVFGCICASRPDLHYSAFGHPFA